jgi:hypothetical protein
MGVNSGLQGGLITLRHQRLELVAKHKLTGRDPLAIRCVFQRVNRLRVQLLKMLPHLVHEDLPVHADLLSLRKMTYDRDYASSTARAQVKCGAKDSNAPAEMVTPSSLDVLFFSMERD